ncbi:hypothetical protein OIO90_000961 [Microbotryomycetes sp. JL221]|nr:hypothetical protein OIO90_000961 [Microbotryomycetes sp. JL221]
MPSKLKKRPSPHKVSHGSSTTTPETPTRASNDTNGSKSSSPIMLRTSAAQPQPSSTTASAALLISDTASIISSVRSERSPSVSTIETTPAASSSPATAASATFSSPSTATTDASSALALLRQRIEEDEIARQHQHSHDDHHGPAKLKKKRLASEVESLGGQDKSPRKREASETAQYFEQTSPKHRDAAQLEPVHVSSPSSHSTPPTVIARTLTPVQSTATNDTAHEIVTTALDVSQHAVALEWQVTFPSLVDLFHFPQQHRIPKTRIQSRRTIMLRVDVKGKTAS